MCASRRAGDDDEQRRHRRHGERAQPAIERLQRIGVQVVDHRHARAAREGPCHAGADGRPIGIEMARPQIQREREADEGERHRPERSPARPFPSQRPGEEHVGHRRCLENEQRQRRRNQRHGRIEAVALRGDE